MYEEEQSALVLRPQVLIDLAQFHFSFAGAVFLTPEPVFERVDGRTARSQVCLVPKELPAFFGFLERMPFAAQQKT